MNELHCWKKIGYCFTPILIYIVMQQIVLSFLPIFIAYTQEMAVLYTMIGALLSMVPNVILYKRQKKNRFDIFTGEKTALWKYTLIIIGALCTSMGLSLIVSMLSIGEKVQSYSQVNQALFSGNIIIQIAAIGFIVPMAEELVFRGLVYSRLKFLLGGAIQPSVITSLLFGLFHQNIVQAICGFTASLFICLVYEQFGQLKAPVLFHICFNLPGVILSYFHFKTNVIDTMAVMALGFIALAVVDAWMIIKLVPGSLHKQRNSG